MVRRALVPFVFLAALMACASSAWAQSAKERVTFATLDPARSVALSAQLLRPAGAGPFPAMVLLHTCAGLQPYVDDWAGWFVSHGYAALVVDSFGPRGVRNVCGGGTPTMTTRAGDALGALAYLRTRPEIDPKRIGAIGWSHGAGAAFVADAQPIVTRSGVSGGGFAAVVSLYAPCGNLRAPIEAIAGPLLFLEGADDDWTPPAACQDDVDALVRGGFPASIHIYPGATHAFDNPSDHGTIHVGPNTYTLNYDAGAARDARDRVLAFLTQNMK